MSGMSDADGDSQMHSSPEIEADENEMFPDEMDEPGTPTHGRPFLLDIASEISPPHSQGPAHLARPEDAATALSGSPTTLNANGKRVHAIPGSTAPETEQPTIQVDPKTGYTWTKPEDEPTYPWTNKRAQEDGSRALEQIIDKGYMIKLRYGDPLDPTIPVKRR